jgi:hypothetical protein
MRKDNQQKISFSTSLVSILVFFTNVVYCSFFYQLSFFFSKKETSQQMKALEETISFTN